MIDKKAAFLAGVSRRCKQTSMDAADEEQIAHLLLMPTKQAACVLGQLVVDRRGVITKEAGVALVKLASADKQPLTYEGTVQPDIEEDPGYITPGSGRPRMPQEAPGWQDPEEAAQLASDPASTTPPAVAEEVKPAPAPAAGSAEDTQKTDSSMSPELPGVSGSGIDAAVDGQPSDQGVIELGGAKTTEQGGDPQRDAIRKAFGATVTPGMVRKGFTADWLERMQRKGLQEKSTNTIMRGIQKQWNLSRRPIRGGLRPGDINPAGITDPDLRQFAEMQKARMAELENREQNLGGGFRRGWSTAGSGFSGGGVRAQRGRGAQPMSMAPPPAAAVAPVRPTGTGTFSMTDMAGGSAAGAMPMTAAPKAYRMSGSTEAFGGDPGRTLSMSYTPPAAATPTPPPPATVAKPTPPPPTTVVEPTQQEAATAQAADPFAVKAQAAEESMMPGIIEEQKRLAGR